MTGWFERHPMVIDALWALLILPFVVVGATEDPASPIQGWWGLPLIAAVMIPMLWRRRHPDVLAGCAVAVHLVLLFATDRFSTLSIVVPIVLYAAAAYSRWRWYRLWLVIAVVGAIAAALRWAANDSVGRWIVIAGFTAGFNLAVVAASWVGGELARSRRRNIEALRERAEALERERDQRTRLAAQEERARIAREMHDIVAHNLSVIVVQADGAQYAATHGSDADARARVAARALETIAATAREALAETRRLVGVLRDEGAEADYAPQATLAQIGELVQRLREAGVPASYEVTGSPTLHAPLSAGAEMAAYRVAQESLTNAVKHGGPGVAVEVNLTHEPGGVVVAVRDTGLGSRGGGASDGAGHGLIGMRERVATYGGTLLARDRMAGGFEVVASLPAATDVGGNAHADSDVRRGA